MANPAYRSSSSVQNQTASTFSVSKPTGTADGDLLIAFQSTAEGLSGTDPATPTGWTLLDSTGFGANRNDIRVFYKVASGEGASWTFNNAGGGLGSCSVYVVAIQNTPTSPPEGDTLADYPGSLVANPGSYTTTHANDLILTGWSFSQGSGLGLTAITPDGSYTGLGLIQSTNGESLNVGYKSAAAAGSVGSNSATATTSGATPANGAILVAVSGAAAAAAPRSTIVRQAANRASRY